jgi:hypothetical protein
MTIEQMFKDAGFTPEYIKSREVYLKGYDSITDKNKPVINKRELLSDTLSDYLKDDSISSFDWDED